MADEKKTLADLLPETEGTTPDEAIKVLQEHIKKQNDSNSRIESLMGILDEIVSGNERIMKLLKSHEGVLKQIAQRPDPKFPEIPPFPKIEFPAPQKFPEI